MGQLKDDMPADLADSLKADEEDRRSDHAPLVEVTENGEVATLTATIETNFRQGDIAIEVVAFSGDQASSETENHCQKSRAEGLRCRLLMWRLSPELGEGGP